MQETQPNRSWIDSLFGFLGRITSSEWKRFLICLGILILVALIVSVGVVFVAIRYLGFRIEAGQVYLGVHDANLSAFVIVDSTTGWQNSGVYLRKGNRVYLEPSGRIHIASNQLYNLAQIVKPLILMGAPDRNWAPIIRKRYSPPIFNESNHFYRDWIGPEGENIPSDMLDACKIRPDLKWGALLSTIFPNQVSDRGDPLRVLQDSRVKASELIPVPAPTEIEAIKDGWLAFIINEAVLSPISDSGESRDFYNSLTRMKAELSYDPRHQLHESSIPLTWFADNIGSFRVIVRRVR